MLDHWLREVRDLLRTQLDETFIRDPDRNILVMPDGQPTATSGEIFVAVHGSGTVGTSLGGPAYTETYMVICTVTQRVRNTPEDRDGDRIYLGDTSSLYRTARKVARTLVNNTFLFNSVRTAILTEDDTAGLLEPLSLSEVSQPQPKYKDWFYSVDPHDGDRQPAGYVIDVSLSGGTVITKTGC